MFVVSLFLWLSLHANQTLDSLLLIGSKGTEFQKTEIYNKLCRYYISSSMDTAKLYCDSAIQNATKYNFKDQKAIAIKNQGILFYYQGLYSEALQMYAKSKVLYLELDDYAGVAALDNNLAIIFEIQGDFENAIKYHLNALQYSEERGTKKEVARSYNNIGSVYGSMGNQTKSLEYLRKSLDLYELINDDIGVANTYNNIAAGYSDIQQHDSAIFYHEKALAIRKKLKDSHGITFSLINIGNRFINLNDNKKAIDYFENALPIVIKNKDRRAETSILTKKAIALSKLGQYNDALKCLENAEHIATTYNYFILLRDIYQEFGNLYNKFGEQNKSFYYMSAFISLNDSLINIENANYIADLESKYQFEKKNQQIIFQEEQLELQSREIRNSKIISILIGIVLLVAIVLIIVIGWTLKNKRNSNQRIEKQNNLLIAQQNQIAKSINYAERIQKSVLPTETNIQQIFAKSFLIYLPKDIVSGDFVWLRQMNNKNVFAVADCTGHGVPGAFMSMLGISFLNEMALRQSLPEPGKILDEMRIFIKNTLNQTGKIGETKDGLYISLCVMDNEFSEMSYASAHHPIYLVRNGDLKQLSNDKQPIGIYVKEESFHTVKLHISKGDQLYFFSDGIVDQFSEESKKRFSSKQFKKLLLDIQDNTSEVQKERIISAFTKWKGSYEQIDDVTVLGIRL